MEQYSTNLTDKQWQFIEKIVNTQKRRRKYSVVKLLYISYRYLIFQFFISLFPQLSMHDLQPSGSSSFAQSSGTLAFLFNKYVIVKIIKLPTKNAKAIKLFSSVFRKIVIIK